MKSTSFPILVVLLAVALWPNGTQALPATQAPAASASVSMSSGWEFMQVETYGLKPQQLPGGDWQPIDLNAPLAIDAAQGIYGWYRLRFNLPNPALDGYSAAPLALFIERIFGSDETYLNGIQIGGLGEINRPWSFVANNPQSLPRNYPIPADLLKTQNNELIIQVNLAYAQLSGFNFFGGTGIDNDVILLAAPAHVEQLNGTRIYQSSMIEVVFVCLALFEGFILLTLFRGAIRHYPELPWLLLSVGFMIASVLVFDVFYLADLRYEFINWLAISAVVYSALGFSLYFWSQYQNIGKRTVGIIAATWCLLGVLILVPGVPESIKMIAAVLWQFGGFFLLLYAIYCIGLGLYQRRTGAVAQATGLVSYLILMRSEWLGINMLDHYDIILGSLLFRYALIVAYFQKIAERSRDHGLLSEKLINTVEHNREAIARELHDDLGQHLAAAKLQLQLNNNSPSEDKVGLALREIVEAISSMRATLQGLHSIVLDKRPVDEVIRQEAERFESLYNVKIDVTSNTLDVPREVARHLLRIFQEAITNAVIHGKATHVAVRIERDAREVMFDVRDDGEGISKDSRREESGGGGFGMVSMRERVMLTNGHLSVTDNQPKGTRLTIYMPVS